MVGLNDRSVQANAGFSFARFKLARFFLIVLVLGCIVSPAMAQVVDTDSVQNQSVGDVVETMKQWKIVMLAVSMVLVIALLFAGGLLRPGGFAKAGLRDVSTVPAVVWFFAAFVVMLAMSSAPHLIGRIQWVQDQTYTVEQMGTINSVGQYILGGIAGIGMLWILKGSASTGENDCGLGLSVLDFPVGLGCFVLAYPCIELLNMLGVWIYTQTQGAAPDGMGHETLKRLTEQPNDPWVWTLVGAAVIGAPIVEELIFRVFIQGALLKSLKSPWLSIIISALLFAGIHRMSPTPVPWHALVPIFAVGLTCGVAYERTKRVGVPIMMHMCFNALNVLLVLMINADAAQTGV